MHMKDRPKIMGSPKVGVGEIDTRAPFHSVKDAVSLFGDTAFSGEKYAIKKVKPFSAEKVLVKETQLHLAQKELNKLQEQLKNAENTKVEALAELEKARQTMEELTKRLKTTSEMKDAAIKATEAAKIQAKQLEESNSSNIAVTNGAQKFDLERTKAQYTTVLSELNAAKQEVAKTHQDCNALLEAKANATKLAVEAEFAVKAHTERADEISRDISGAKETIEKVRQTLIKTQHEQVEIFSEKDRQRKSYQASLYEYAKKLQVIKKEFDPELSKNLDVQLAETMGEIETLQNEINNAKVSDVDSMRSRPRIWMVQRGHCRKCWKRKVPFRACWSLSSVNWRILEKCMQN
ncbi:hypothetical protein Nepgr_026888 [Nepenthes gracilis]|uniref:Uncharacterized protein n=1 Tax=Nepenthes gracilis TaxID=150966 RepID=A0AAD3T8V3_NEPGR|nr:hypothetical protein Nepgr_026888 [Nepenthes gracilis]